MRRRDILLVLGGVAVSHPGIAHAEKPRLIAYMSPSPRRPDTTGAFFAELARRGYAEGRNLTVLFYDFLAEPAAALRLAIPPLLRARADEVIE